MLKNIIIVFAFVAACLITVNIVLKDGLLLKHMDQKPHQQWIPTVGYLVGEGYFIKRDLTTAATYFIRIVERYPASEYAEKAYFDYLECLGKGNRTPRPELIQVCETYLERFPNGEHAEIVRVKLGAYRSGL